MSPMNLASACTNDATNGWDVLLCAVVLSFFLVLLAILVWWVGRD